MFQVLASIFFTVKLLNVYLKGFDGRVFITCALVSTQPELDIISGWSREVLTEPGGTVEGAACTTSATPSTIP